MSTFKITIPFNPKPKASVRTGKYSHYNPSKLIMLDTRRYVRKYAESIGHVKMKGPLLVIVHFKLPISLTLPKRLRFDQLPHVKRPDGDNLEKFLNDSLNDLVWQDDSQICWLLRSKSRTKKRMGETILFVRELPNSTPNYDRILSDIMEHIKIGELDEFGEFK